MLCNNNNKTIRYTISQHFLAYSQQYKARISPHIHIGVNCCDSQPFNTFCGLQIHGTIRFSFMKHKWINWFWINWHDLLKADQYLICKYSISTLCRETILYLTWLIMNPIGLILCIQSTPFHICQYTSILTNGSYCWKPKPTINQIEAHHQSNRRELIYWPQ